MAKLYANPALMMYTGGGASASGSVPERSMAGGGTGRFGGGAFTRLASA